MLISILVEGQIIILGTRITNSRMVFTEIYFPIGIHAMGQEYLPKVKKLVRRKGHIVYSNMLVGIFII